MAGRSCAKPRPISIHAPRTGSDLSARRLINGGENFNPRSPHGERPNGHICLRHHRISIHAPRTGSDRCSKRQIVRQVSFQSTLPARGATLHGCRQSPRETGFQSTLPARGATPKNLVRYMWMHHFNPRSPHGERPSGLAILCTMTIISIHAPRTGSDARNLRM